MDALASTRRPTSLGIDHLVAAFGPLCAAAAASQVPASTTTTSPVRGLLCLYCNTHVDDCLHLAECPFADDLNAPPAAAWKAFHPNGRGARTARSSKARIAALGYDRCFAAEPSSAPKSRTGQRRPTPRGSTYPRLHQTRRGSGGPLSAREPGHDWDACRCT